ncbi:hypothetical protein SeLEV6574_g04262 [Synchytrium endobioticum]|uniref:Uncharacterized protein n=1 Tax=Synchytrium endobioticum TaxID=286115 RepID=A0A507D091_9FUNG|nr:hypothetical protein SeLEV6574_g04262 [Synchytrium endobioticum]
MIDDDIDILDIDDDSPPPPPARNTATQTGSAQNAKRKQPTSNRNTTRQPPKKKAKTGPIPSPEATFDVSEWLQQTWAGLADDVDDSSKSLIQSLLAQDQMDILHAAPRDVQLFRHASTSFDAKQKQKKRKSAPPTATHSTRWTEEEDEALKAAIKKHGFGSWTSISDVVKTRTPLQVKNHARHLASMGIIVGKSTRNKSTSSTDESTPPIINKLENLAGLGDSSSSCKSNSARNNTAAVTYNHKTRQKVKNEDEQDEEEDDEEIDIDLDDFNPELFVESPLSMSAASSTPLRVSPLSDAPSSSEPRQSSVASSNVPIVQLSSSTTPQPVSSHLHQVQLVQPPSNEIPPFPMTPETKTINVFESASLPEWFPPYARGLKTPDRYIRVRSGILSLWASNAERYLTKTCVRRELPNEGDVNAISRVHEFLSTYGWINKGLAKKRGSGGGNNKACPGDESDHETEDAGSGTMSKRKRRVRNHLGEWVDPGDLEGRTISHLGDRDDGSDEDSKYTNFTEERRLLARNARYFADSELEKYDSNLANRIRTRHSHRHHHANSEYDPFTLISFQTPCNGILPATSPQHISVSATVLMIMDIHAHLAHTEIIGLLGGSFRPETKTLEITDVIPCNSDSTDIQCEMDPISELHARTILAAKNLVVVGWYHSHPTFEPKPSVRDLENQGAYQTLFRHEDGSEPFVGAIVAPYMPSNASNVSVVTWMAVDERPANSTFRLPFVVNPTTVQSSRITDEDIIKVQQLVNDYKDRKDCVDLAAVYRQTASATCNGDTGVAVAPHVTKLDKVMESITSYFGCDGLDQAGLDRVKWCLAQD